MQFYPYCAANSTKKNPIPSKNSSALHPRVVKVFLAILPRSCSGYTWPPQ